ncbi:MAG: GNAT family N-acetyltransferase [Paracoccaceae bacterium]|jgi:[ribosomal protein S18]-alanine N-acetyltransferase|nr:GNAT family N-acetyltransferase [Paracoccaceae bacterium]
MTPEKMAAIHQSAFTHQRPWSASEFRDLLASDLVWSVNSGDYCFALGRTVAGETEVLTIATDSAKQRRGLAKSCLKSFLTESSARETQTVYLEVDAKNIGAIALYSGFGFRETGRRQGYYRHPNGVPSDAVIMAL